MTPNTRHLAILAALTLAACSSGGSGSGAVGDISNGLADALTKPFSPHDKGLKQLSLSSSVPQNATMTLSAQGREKAFKTGDTLNTGALPTDKISDFNYITKIIVDGETIPLESGTFQVYKQDYSAITALQTEKAGDPQDHQKLIDKRSFRIGDIGGDATDYAALPANGRATYRGTAFSSDDRGGRLNYTIDFGSKQGSGSIEHLKSPEYNVALHTAEIRNWDGKSVISGDAHYRGQEVGSYQLGIFGNRAQEIAGVVTVNTANGEQQIGFAGKQ